jgi:hypothetical protein
MKFLLNKRGAECRDFQMQLEDAAGSAPGAKKLADLLAAVPGAMRGHAAECADCRAAAENMLAARALMAEMPSRAAVGGPWFAPRVMAAIAARKAELGRAADTWTFLPKLAARLTWASTIALLLASGWLYQKPASTSAKPAMVTDITGEPLVDTTTPENNDDVLINLTEQPR